MRAQRQESGNASTNFQAGRDVAIHVGPSLEEVRTVALDVFRANFLELQGIAADVARARAEAITEAFISHLQDRSPQALQAAANPDMQRALFAAQREYACSGDADLEQALVDLLVERAERADRSIEAIVLNEAINSVPKLTPAQRRAIAICFLVRYTSWSGSMTLDAVYQHFRESWVPVARELPKTVTAYQHIEYVGAGSVNRISEMTFAGAVSDSYRAWFNGGVASDEVPEPLRSRVGDNRLFVPNVRNPARVQLPINHEPEIEQLAAAVGVAELVPELRQVFALQGSTPPQQVHLEFQERVPELGEMIETWDTSDLKCLTLTTVGIAIGHAYWRRVIPGHGALLAAWIAE